MYNFGCDNEWENIEIVKRLLIHLKKPESLIQLVKDRPGHDRRYAMGYAKAQRDLGWEPVHTFEEGLSETIEWYLANEAWWQAVTSGEYQSYYEKQYAAR